jgi:hypothetical protein
VRENETPQVLIGYPTTSSSGDISRIFHPSFTGHPWSSSNTNSHQHDTPEPSRLTTISRFRWRNIPQISTRLVFSEPFFESATLLFYNKQPPLTSYREYSSQPEGTLEQIFFTHLSGRSFTTNITVSSAVCFSKNVKTADLGRHLVIVGDCEISLTKTECCSRIRTE